MATTIDVSATVEEQIIQEAIYLNFDGNSLTQSSGYWTYTNSNLIGKQNVIVINYNIYSTTHSQNVMVISVPSNDKQSSTYYDSRAGRIYGGGLSLFFNSNTGTVYFATAASAYDNYCLVAW